MTESAALLATDLDALSPERALSIRDRERLETLAIELEAAGHHRVLRRLERRNKFDEPNGRPVRLGAVVDVETVGLDPRRHELIELAILPFIYSTDGAVLEAKQPFASFREPSEAIPAGITRLTGIDDDMVRGCSIDPDEVAKFIEPMSLIVAHNARFDRPFLERFCPAFGKKPWACSQTQVPWSKEGFDGTKLFYLATHHRLFFDAHRALDDCWAVLEILARRLPRSGGSALAALLQQARTPTYRVWAIGAPFDTRELLKGSGYRWNDGADGRPRAWHKDVERDELEAEIAMLEHGPFFEGLVEPFVQELDAYVRFSDRS